MNKLVFITRVICSLYLFLAGIYIIAFMPSLNLEFKDYRLFEYTIGLMSILGAFLLNPIEYKKFKQSSTIECLIVITILIIIANFVVINYIL